MKNHECRRKFYALPLFIVLIAAALLMGACTTPEKAKAQHVARGQALLKDKKFQEASLEFRNETSIDPTIRIRSARSMPVCRTVVPAR